MFKSYRYFTTLYNHIPLYRTPIFIEQSQPIPIDVRKHTDFGIENIPIKARKLTSNDIITQTLLTKNILSYLIPVLSTTWCIYCKCNPFLYKSILNPNLKQNIIFIIFYFSSISFFTYAFRNVKLDIISL